MNEAASSLQASNAKRLGRYRDDLLSLCRQIRTMRDAQPSGSALWESLNSAWIKATEAFGGANELIANCGALTLIGEAAWPKADDDREPEELHSMHVHGRRPRLSGAMAAANDHTLDDDDQASASITHNGSNQTTNA
jgi:hypothetical protein